MRQQDDGALTSPLSSQGSDNGETPLFVGFSHQMLGNIVEQQWSPYGVYTHFLRHRVAEMMMNEPQSGTITFGLSKAQNKTIKEARHRNVVALLLKLLLLLLLLLVLLLLLSSRYYAFGKSIQWLSLIHI